VDLPEANLTATVRAMELALLVLAPADFLPVRRGAIFFVEEGK
jgi:hypothetical protein